MEVGVSFKYVWMVKSAGDCKILKLLTQQTTGYTPVVLQLFSNQKRNFPPIKLIFRFLWTPLNSSYP